jgi:signal transduction histidine kinase
VVAAAAAGAATPRPGGVGLGSMRRRAESVGGVLTVESVPGRGTRVRADLPIPEEDG